MVGGDAPVEIDSEDSAAVADRELLERELRSQIQHSLASPVRGIAILADLLEEALSRSEADIADLREISAQLTKLADEASGRLANFGSPESG